MLNLASFSVKYQRDKRHVDDRLLFREEKREVLRLEAIVIDEEWIEVVLPPLWVEIRASAHPRSSYFRVPRPPVCRPSMRSDTVRSLRSGIPTDSRRPACERLMKSGRFHSVELRSYIGWSLIEEPCLQLLSMNNAVNPLYIVS